MSGSKTAVKSLLFVVILLSSISGCARIAVERTAAREFSLPSPTGLCRVDNIRAIRGNGIIVSGMYRYRDEVLRHVTAYRRAGNGLERVDLTCPQCEPAGRPILIVHVKDYRITRVEEGVREKLNPLKIAYIKKALEIEAEREGKR